MSLNISRSGTLVMEGGIVRIKRPTRSGIAARFGCCLPRRGREQSRRGGGPFVIPHCTKSVEALLQSNDAFGYIGINDAVAEYILQSAWEELLRVGPMRRKVEIAICTLESGPMDAKQVQLVQIAMQNTFRQLAMLAEIEIVRSAQTAWSSAWKSLWGGTVCVGAVAPLAVYYHDTFQYWAMILGQLFVVVLWVLIWHPFESLVYDRIEIRKRLQVCQRLDDAKVTLVVFDDIKEEQEEFIGTATPSSTLLVDNGSRAKASRFGFEIVHITSSSSAAAAGKVVMVTV